MLIIIMNKINKFGALTLLLALVVFAGCGEQINHLEVGELLLKQALDSMVLQRLLRLRCLV